MAFKPFWRDLPPIVRNGLVLPLLLLNGWCLLVLFEYFRTPITLFLISSLLAYLLGFPVKLLQRFRIPRVWAVAIVVISILVLLGLVGLTVVPLIINQIVRLGQAIPRWVEATTQQWQALEHAPWTQGLPFRLQDIAEPSLQRLGLQLQDLSSRFVDLTLTTANGLVQFALALVLTLYLLLRGDEFWSGIMGLLPVRLREASQQAWRLSFQNYLRGQMTMAVLIGLSSMVVFAFLKIEFWLLFGLFIMVLAFFPFGGSAGIVVVSFLLMLSNFRLGLWAGLVAWLADQLIENFLGPRLLGRFTGVHPAWVLLSLLIGAQVAGFLGVILAVPMAGFVKFMLDLYRQEAPPTPPQRSASSA
jgi:predicted PurR-regulated permease PerM